MNSSLHSHKNIRRIRHLRHILVRRIASQEIVTTYFTLHSYPHTSKIFYTSEKQLKKRNPTFRNLSAEQFSLDVDQSSSHFIFRLWAASSHKYASDRVLLEWIIDMNKLVSIENHKIGLINLPNMVIIGLSKPYKNNVYFTSSHFTETLKASRLIDLVITQNPEISYDCDTLKMISTLRTSCLVERQTATEAKTNAKQILEKQIIYAKELETLKTNMSVLKKRKFLLQQKVNQERETLNSLKEQINSTSLSLSRQTKELEMDKTNLHTKRDMYMMRKELLMSTLYDITFRRLTLIKDAGFIYEIHIPQSYLINPKDNTTNEYPTISNIQLPLQNSIFSSSVNDIDISTSLGFVTHLVQCISIYLLLPLRFPVYFFSSQSLVLNDNVESTIDEFRELPLFLKRRNELSVHRLEQGFFLLNHNIMQIRQHLGLSTSSPRQTLINLQNIFEETENSLCRLKQTRRSSLNLLAQVSQSNLDGRKLSDLTPLLLEMEDEKPHNDSNKNIDT